MKKKLLMLASVFVMGCAMTACGSSNGSSGTDTTTTAENSDVGESDDASAEDSTESTEDTAGGALPTKLIMGTNAEFPPYEYHEGSEIVGIDAEVAAAIAAELGMEFEIEDMNFDSIIPSLLSGKVNIGMAGMTVTEDRLQNVDFSDTYAQATQVMIVKKDSDITTKADLEGKTIGVQLGTTGDIYASDVKDAVMERYNKGFEAVQSLLQGKVDVVVIDNEPAKVFVSNNEDLMILEEAFEEEQYAIAVAKGDTELLEAINGALAKLTESGEIQKIIDKYITAE